jgi:hypothetical protein
MKNRTLALPLLVVTALVALVLGSFGTATAAGLTTGQVKKVATKVINKKAKTLSVAHATTADTSANAGNATNLNGLASSAYLDRVAYSASSLSGPALPAGTATEARQVSLTVPSGVNFVHVTGNASAEAGSATLAVVWYSVDTPCSTLSGFGYDRRVQFQATPSRDNGTTDVVQPLAGTHVFRLCVYATGAANVTNASLAVETVSLNGTGGASRPAGSESSGSQSPTGR